MLKPIAEGPVGVLPQTTEQPPATRWALAALALSMLLSSLGTSIANVGLPALTLAFDASFADVQWIVLAYLLAITTLIVGAGRLGDIAGRRRLLLGGIALFTAASVACSVAPTLWVLVAARAVQGLGAAIMLALSMALVGDTVGKARTGSAMGVLGTMSAVGTALGPSLGGILIAAGGWRAIFLVSVPPGIAALLLARRHLPADRPLSATQATGFDRAGTLLLAATLAAYALAVTPGSAHFGPPNIVLLLVAVVGAALFVRTEARLPTPLIRVEMLREPVLGTRLAASALVATVMMTTLVVGPFHLSRALGLGTAVSGLVLAVGPVVAALTGIPAGRLADRYGAQRMTTVGLAASAAGSFLLFVLPATVGLAGYLVPIGILTAGYGLFQTANNTAVMKEIGADQRGLVGGMLNLSRNLGLITGASLMGAIFAAGSAATDVATAQPADVAQGFRVAFAAATVLVLVALLLTSAAKRRAAARPTARPGDVPPA